MLIINAVVFFLCLVPFEVYRINYFSFLLRGVGFMSGPTATMLIEIGRVSSLLNATINPVIYNMTSSQYRVASKKAFLSLGCMSNDANNKDKGVSTLSLETSEKTFNED